MWKAIFQVTNVMVSWYLKGILINFAKVVGKLVLTSLFSGARFVLSDLSTALFEMQPCLREQFIK